MTLKVQIELNGEAFTDEVVEQELSRIFALIATRATCGVTGDGQGRPILDINGNICGRWSVKD